VTAMHQSSGLAEFAESEELADSHLSRYEHVSNDLRWTRERAALLALACLLAGIAGGWSIHGRRSTAPAAAVGISSAPAPGSTSQVPDPARLMAMADAQAAPLLEKLKADPANPELLASVGNLYYDAQQYPIAVDYYARSLKGRPSDAAVRTDMGTAFWFMGNSGRAIAEFNKALAFAPNNPNTLFNLGLVKWKGNQDAAGARAAWEQLLKADPAYEQKDQVEKMLAEVNGQTTAAAQPN
jgi:cytochrome c-type biogenesis protein CcmH/NrfG